MSFFAGRLNGVPTFSLKNQTGGDINQHINPDNATIFHSSMPHVLITEQYESGLSARENGYWTCAMPSRIASLLAGDPDLVVLTEVEFIINGIGIRRMLYGGGSSVGAANWQCSWTDVQMVGGRPITIPHFFGNIGTNFIGTNDVIGDHGYFNEGAGGSMSAKLLYGTGRKYSINGMSTWESYQGASGTYYNNSNPTSGSPTYNLDVGQIIPPCGNNRGFDSFYIRSGIPLIQMSYQSYVSGSFGSYGAPSPPGGTAIQTLHNFVHDYTGGGGRALDAGLVTVGGPYEWITTSSNSRTEYELRDTNYGLQFNRVRWYVTNLRFNGNGYNIAANPFTGNSILLSKNNFTIRDVNLMNTGFKFINLVTGAQQANRPDMWVTSPNIYRWDDGANLGWGDLPWNGVAANSMQAGLWAGAGAGYGATTMSIYQFQPSASWYVDSRQPPRLGNQWGDVWSTGQLPMRLFTDRTATVNISSGLAQIAGSTVGLAEVGLGMSDAREGAVVMTMEFTDNSWFTSSGRGMYNPNRWGNTGDGIGAGPLRMSGSGNSSTYRRHMILCLPIGAYVPFYVCRCGSMASYGNDRDTGSHNTSYYSTTYYVRNQGNGNLYFSAEVASTPIASIPGGTQNNAAQSVNDYNAVRLPNMRLTVQRLA